MSGATAPRPESLKVNDTAARGPDSRHTTGRKRSALVVDVPSRSPCDAHPPALRRLTTPDCMSSPVSHLRDLTRDLEEDGDKRRRAAQYLRESREAHLQERRLYLVLDLDETLVHSLRASVRQISPPAAGAASPAAAAAAAAATAMPEDGDEDEEEEEEAAAEEEGEAEMEDGESELAGDCDEREGAVALPVGGAHGAASTSLSAASACAHGGCVPLSRSRSSSSDGSSMSLPVSLPAIGPLPPGAAAGAVGGAGSAATAAAAASSTAASSTAASSAAASSAAAATGADAPAADGDDEQTEVTLQVQNVEFEMRLRPGVHEFLREMSSLFCVRHSAGIDHISTHLPLPPRPLSHSHTPTLLPLPRATHPIPRLFTPPPGLFTPSPLSLHRHRRCISIRWARASMCSRRCTTSTRSTRSSSPGRSARRGRLTLLTLGASRLLAPPHPPLASPPHPPLASPPHPHLASPPHPPLASPPHPPLAASPLARVQALLPPTIRVGHRSGATGLFTPMGVFTPEDSTFDAQIAAVSSANLGGGGRPSSVSERTECSREHSAELSIGDETPPPGARTPPREGTAAGSSRELPPLDLPPLGPRVSAPLGLPTLGGCASSLASAPAASDLLNPALRPIRTERVSLFVGTWNMCAPHASDHALPSLPRGPAPRTAAPKLRAVSLAALRLPSCRPRAALPPPSCRPRAALSCRPR